MKTVGKVQCENKKLHEVQIGLEENVTRLENVVETRDLKIDSLEEELKISEEQTECFNCKTCEVNIGTKSDLKKHIDGCSDENLPSTSKCGTCDYKSDGDDDMRVDMKSKHEVQCNLCRYVCDNEEDLNEHVNSIHEKLNYEEYNCVTCDLTLKTKDKLKKHICKVRVQNPSYGTLYMKGWYDKNGCTQMFSSKLNKEIAWLHSDSCVIEECAPFKDITIDIKEAIIQDEDEHLKLECFVENGNILWAKFTKAVKVNDVETTSTGNKE